MKTNWPIKKLGEVIEYEQPTKYLVSSTDYKEEYPIPVLTAGKSFILGNTNEKNGVFPKGKLPVIIFDDFTTAIKFVDFPFKVKSSAMKILHAKKSVADIKYLFNKLLTIKFPHNQHKRYWISECSKIEIPLPPLYIQKQIVERLDKVAEAQKLNDELIQKSDELFQSLLHKELNPAGPADAKAMAGKKDWEIKELGEVALLVRGPFGGSLRKDIFVKSGDCVYEQGNVIDCDLENFRYFVTPDKFRQMKRFEVLAGDILMSCSGTIGKFVIIPRNFRKGIINQALLKITPNQKVVGEFLKFTLENYFSLNKSHVKGIAIKNIAAVKELKKVKIPLPSLETQKQIVAKLSAVQDYRGRLLEQKSKLKELFESVLHKSMSAT